MGVLRQDAEIFDAVEGHVTTQFFSRLGDILLDLLGVKVCLANLVTKRFTQRLTGAVQNGIFDRGRIIIGYVVVYIGARCRSTTLLVVTAKKGFD